MVGVPKSKGCQLCLQRSIKCDEARPSCLQCRIGARACPGYTRGMKFVDEGPGLERRRQQRKQGPRQSRCIIRNNQRSGRSSPLYHDDQIKESHKTENVFLVRNNDGGASSKIYQYTTMPRDLRSRLLERQQILYSFVSTMFPLHHASTSAPSPSLTQPQQASSFLGCWLWHVPPRLGFGHEYDKAGTQGNRLEKARRKEKQETSLLPSQVLEHAALALAFAYFASKEGDGDSGGGMGSGVSGVGRSKSGIGTGTRRAAQEAYVRALGSLAPAIADAQRRYEGDVLCAVLLLGHYESFFDTPGGKAWIKHAGGAARLMQARGPERCYESAFEYSMFLTCRGAIIQQALVSGESCFLDTETWRSIPDGLIEFPIMPQPAKLLHDIFTYFAAVPGLVKRAKITTRDVTAALSVVEDAASLRRDMKNWYQQYLEVDGGLRQPRLERVNRWASTDQGEPEDGYPFPYRYVYTDVVPASVILTYFAYLIVVNQQIMALDERATASCYQENTELAESICMSVDYCSRGGYCGSHVLGFALPIACSALSGGSERKCAQWWTSKGFTSL